MDDSSPLFTRPDLVRAVRGEQRQRWQRGERVPVEDLLQAHPSLLNDTEGILDLIYSEVLLREQSGETPSLDDYLSRFPQWADDLRNQFEVHSVLEEPNPTPGSKPVSRLRLKSGAALPPAAPAALPQGPPGYLILSELGRGGMGVVWKARHERLNRIVALKMIRHGSEARSEERRRFDIEAQSVARLSHPHIVQIYEVGEHEGQPYLSLEFVNGPSLAQQLGGAPLPPRDAAELVETLARAMQYAHDMGILHRDLKPANVLLQEDLTQRRKGAKEEEAATSSFAPLRLCVRSSVPKITDFGLAKQIDVDTGQTQSGMLIGTPSYMAPEQSGDPEAKHHEAIGPPADVYALGAVLYECLTGRPPFRGVTLVDTLLQVRTQDPVPPTQLQPQCPRDVETICLKCLSKTPPKRYARAADLADDLRRFLAGEPIHARPTPWHERAWKWARRRPTAAAALVAGALLLVVLVGFTFALQAARNRAESNFEKAFQAVDDFFVRVAENPRLRQYDQRPLLKELLEQAQPYYEELARLQSNDPRLRPQQAKAYRRLAEIVAVIDGPANALAHAQLATALLRTLTAERADEELQRELAASLDLEGELCRLLGKHEEALAAGTASRDLRQTFVEAHPENVKDRANLAQSWNNLGVLHHDVRSWKHAEEAYQQSRALRQKLADEDAAPRHRNDLAQSWNNLGLLFHDQKQRDKAAEAYGEALRIREPLVQEFNTEPNFRFARTKSRHNLAGVERLAERWTQAHEAYEQAVKDMEYLVQTHPSVLEYRDHLALFRYNWALLWHYQDVNRDLKRAGELYGLALAIWESLPETYRRDLPLTRRRMAQCLYEWGKCELLDKQPASAQDKLAKAVQLFASLPRTRLLGADEPAEDDRARLEQARGANQQGNAHYPLREWSKAIPFFRDSVALWPDTEMHTPDRLYEVGIIWAKLSHCCEGERQWKDALASAEKALLLWQDVPEHQVGLRRYRARMRGTQALAWAHRGEAAKARTAAEDVQRQEPDWQWAGYRLARIYAVQAAQRPAASPAHQTDMTEALRLLEQSSSTFLDRALVQAAEAEPDLELLRPLPEFQSWLEKLKKATETPTRSADPP